MAVADRWNKYLTYKVNKMKQRIKEYNEKPVSFIRDMMKHGVTEELDTFWDLMQYLSVCRPSPIRHNFISNLMLKYKKFAFASNWGYIIPQYETISKFQIHRPVSNKHVIKLLGFFELNDIVNLTKTESNCVLIPPRMCKTSIQNFGDCPNMLQYKKFVCSDCIKYDFDMRCNLRYYDLLVKPKRDNFIERAPDIALFSKL